MKKIKIFSDIRYLSFYAAEFFTNIANNSIKQRKKFYTALSGGSTPQLLYAYLANPHFREVVDWQQTHFFWGDERCVPPDAPESCYQQAYSTLLQYMELPEENIVRIKGELTPEAAAADYASRLLEFSNNKSSWPIFDLVILGLGADGHTASLFPYSPETNGISSVSVTAKYQERPSQRVSLTPDVFNSARNIIFLAAGVEKSQAVFDTICGLTNPEKLPAQRIQPNGGNILWLLDTEAAKLLPGKISGYSVENRSKN